MGIENQMHGARAGTDTTHSLPLMGIENDWRSRSAKSLPGLITPHGDRKPDLTRQLSRRNAKLITPHGDRKHAAMVNKYSTFMRSLPLMGIEND